TGQQLRDRHIDAEIKCCRCGEPETILHLLFTCQFAINVWRMAPFKTLFQSHLVEEVSVGLRGAKLQICLPPTGLVTCPLFPWICWSLWKARNQKIFNGRSFSVEETAGKALSDAKEWQEAQCKGSATHRLLTRCNSDAAWRSDLNVAGLGWIRLDPGMNDFSSHSAICESVSSPLMAESLACRAAVMDAQVCGASHLILDSDCQLLVRAINTRSSIAEVHGVLSDIYICIKSFISFSCRFIPRATNVSADSLAKQVLSLYGSSF
ncbi:unnamed protein product, partial [Arabidopsis halleri]